MDFLRLLRPSKKPPTQAEVAEAIEAAEAERTKLGEHLQEMAEQLDTARITDRQAVTGIKARREEVSEELDTIDAALPRLHIKLKSIQDADSESAAATRRAEMTAILARRLAAAKEFDGCMPRAAIVADEFNLTTSDLANYTDLHHYSIEITTRSWPAQDAARIAGLGLVRLLGIPLDASRRPASLEMLERSTWEGLI